MEIRKAFEWELLTIFHQYMAFIAGFLQIYIHEKSLNLILPNFTLYSNSSGITPGSRKMYGTYSIFRCHSKKTEPMLLVFEWEIISDEIEQILLLLILFSFRFCHSFVVFVYIFSTYSYKRNITRNFEEFFRRQNLPVPCFCCFPLLGFGHTNSNILLY